MIKEALGWSHKFNLQTYIDADIEDFCRSVDGELGCFGIGFLSAFFHISKEELTKFQDMHGCFPFDAYLTLWEGYMNHVSTNTITKIAVTYNQRNLCLETLIKKGFITKATKRDTYEEVSNPFSKHLLRRKNLNTLL